MATGIPAGGGGDADTIDGYDTPLPAAAINDGSGSGLDADLLDGEEGSTTSVTALYIEGFAPGFGG